MDLLLLMTSGTSGSYSYENGQSYTVEDGKWHHICGWFNKSSPVDKKIFIDGVYGGL